MKSLWKVWFSRKRSIYIRIARQCRSTPWRVYYLGHGGISRSIKDMKILKALQQQGIISRIYPW
ncbi:hypothetical protein NXX54_08195 [Bacteroides sp. BFG-638]|uniref:Uncharacterized protein n=2 Tax=Bacteroides TaxID=816 RepID=A0AAW6IB34_BACOV|nr:MULTISPECIES: hypothetical protein [Bacteroides]MBV3833609.1 hypothetical protein [Bacteroides xylanisolvens]MBV3876620.1 hypothetical protein [Bacteroides xylanisolvens]MBV3881909.1 hypothetical protein [Bacteroides xylanisolvens]MBV3907942.1 hypothetical protein [Bacteroides xylanisolvens]MBV3913509.1 hypothetical protein [Bacteroides xylanisolvens]